MAYAQRPLLLVDPSGASVAFVRACVERFGSVIGAGSNTATKSQVHAVSCLDSAFTRTLESCLRFGTTLVALDCEAIDPVLFPILNGDFERVAGRVTVRLSA